MNQLLAVCGINCADCPAYIATQNNDDAARAKVAAEWSQGYETQFLPEDINCDGCTRVGGRCIAFVNKCDVRACGFEKNLKNCGYCGDYPCDKLDKIFGMVPEAKVRLDEIKAALKK